MKYCHSTKHCYEFEYVLVKDHGGIIFNIGLALHVFYDYLDLCDGNV